MKAPLFAVVALTTTALVPVSAAAQQNQGQAGGQNAIQESARQQQQAQQRQAQQLTPQEFVRRAAISNMFEIESSRLAQEQARNQRVRQFAERMVREHTQVGQSLRQALQQAGDRDLTMPTSLDRSHQQNLEQLRGARGRQFDRAYVRMQTDAHEQAVDLFNRFTAMESTPPLDQFADETLPKLSEHYEAILQIQDDLFPESGTARRGGDGRRQANAGEQAGGQREAQGSEIVIQRTRPQVRVEQGSPRVTVQQARPEVTVQQAVPEIIVRQPQPTISVDIPQPQITVRMPQPDVNVQQALPQVSVQQPEPRVRVQRSEQNAQIELNRSQPNVNVQRGGEARVNVQRSSDEPIVRYQREEPRVVINRAQGQPTVRYERMNPDQQQSQQTAEQQGARQAQPDQRQAQQDQRQAQSRIGTSDEERARARQRLGPTSATQGAASDDNEVRRRAVLISQVEGMDVYNGQGDNLGEADAVVQTSDGRQFVVIANGGFLGIGEDKVVFPVDRFWIRGDRLMIRGVSEDDIENMADYRDRTQNYYGIGRNQSLQLREWM